MKVRAQGPIWNPSSFQPLRPRLPLGDSTSAPRSAGLSWRRPLRSRGARSGDCLRSSTLTSTSAVHSPASSYRVPTPPRSSPCNRTQRRHPFRATATLWTASTCRPRPCPAGPLAPMCHGPTWNRRSRSARPGAPVWGNVALRGPQVRHVWGRGPAQYVPNGVQRHRRRYRQKLCRDCMRRGPVPLRVWPNQPRELCPQCSVPREKCMHAPQQAQPVHVRGVLAF